MSIHQFISQVPLFATMDEDERAALAERMDGRCLHKGDKLFSRGDKGDSLMIIREGRVQIYVESGDGNKIVLGELQAGELLGEVSLFDPGPRTATAVALEHTDVLILEHEDLWEVLQHKPHIALDILGVLGKRLRDTDELLRGQVTRNLNVKDRETLTIGQRAAETATRVTGSWSFLGGFVVLVIALAAFTIGPNATAWKDHPIVLLALAFAAVAALQTSVIIMAQKREEKRARLRGDLEYDVHLKAEIELAQLGRKVEEIHEAMQLGSKPEAQRGAARGSSS